MSIKLKKSRSRWMEAIGDNLNLILKQDKTADHAFTETHSTETNKRELFPSSMKRAKIANNFMPIQDSNPVIIPKNNLSSDPPKETIRTYKLKIHWKIG